MSLIQYWERVYAAVKVKINTALETYEKNYGMIDYKDKVVVDIGADFGSTARFFLRKGAKKVIAYEANPILRLQLLENFYTDTRLEIHGAWEGKMPKGDVLKMDCEGCEYSMTEAQLQQFPKWAVGVHCPRKKMYKVLQIEAMLTRNGGRLVSDMGFERLWVKA